MANSKKLLSELLSPATGDRESKYWKISSVFSESVNEEREPKIISPASRVTDLVNKVILNEGPLPEVLLTEGHQLISDLSSDIAGFTAGWDVGSHQTLLGLVLIFSLYEQLDNVQNKRLKAAILEELTRRQRQDKDRIKERQDRVDKRAFQAALRANIEEYSKSTIEDAITKLQDKYSQFRKRRKATLRNWAKPVWPVPTKPGRPKKKEVD